MQGQVDYVDVIWRGIRGFFGTLVALIIGSAISAASGLGSVPLNVSDPKNTIKALIVAFVLGFLAALFKAIRDKFGDPKGPADGFVNKIPL